MDRRQLAGNFCSTSSFVNQNSASCTLTFLLRDYIYGAGEEAILQLFETWQPAEKGLGCLMEINLQHRSKMDNLD